MSEWPKKLKIFVFHVNAYQRVTSAEDGWNDLVCGQQRASFPSCPWANERSGRGGRDGCHAGALQHALPHPNADLLMPLLSTQSASQIPTLSP